MHKKMYLKKQQQTLQIYLIRFEENGLQQHQISSNLR